MNEFGPPEGEGYDLQAVYTEKITPFWFRWSEQWWRLPHLKMLDLEIQTKVEEFNPTSTSIEDVNAFFDLLMGKDQGARWREVVRPLPMLMDMLGRWVEHSGGTLGEPPASPDSSKSTGRPSKRTSIGSTASASRRPSKAAKAATPRGNS